MISSRKCEEDISNLSKLGTTILSAKVPSRITETDLIGLSYAGPNPETPRQG